MRGVIALCLTVLFASSTMASADDLARAEGLLERKDYAGAESVLREILRAEPRNARAHGNLALALMPQRKLREAVDEGRLAAAIEPESPQARYIYGMTLRAADRGADAQREFAKASALAPDAVGPLDALAEAYAAAGDDRAIGAYERLVSLAPTKSRYRLALADSLWRAGQAEKGNAVAAAAVDAFDGDAPLRTAYGIALFDQQRFADAAVQLARASELGDRGAETLGLLGDALWQAGRTAEAETALRFAVARHPDSSALRLELGQLLLSLGKGAAARAELEEAARLAPRDAAIAFQLGRALEAAGAPADAEAAYRRAIELSPNLAAPRYALGTLLVRQGRRKEGEEQLALHHTLYARASQRIFEAQSSHGAIQLAESQISRGQAGQALALLDGFPESADLLRARAQALSGLGRHEEAVAALERARELEPDAARLRTLLAAERARVAKTP